MAVSRAVGGARTVRRAARRRRPSVRVEGCGSCGTAGWRRRRATAPRLLGGLSGSPSESLLPESGLRSRTAGPGPATPPWGPACRRARARRWARAPGPGGWLSSAGASPWRSPEGGAPAGWTAPAPGSCSVCGSGPYGGGRAREGRGHSSDLALD